ncbi:phosphatase PAP2 family protein [Roseisolibacter sp. H3M3-2]|uniref:phosphatase PAP2 family protein n=1 Tax=Roseisolibacter sp. H3M3-2 TaxID=3031323 RepID=UPI0023DC9A7C|nr:phosphatase PAP2 family protein [Roseisolibacter sp. H3M3-2]MDF1502328.1 phosphatase PAP2 family protein [Roseisolibacter sp. H3M3-2]
MQVPPPAILPTVAATAPRVAATRCDWVWPVLGAVVAVDAVWLVAARIGIEPRSLALELLAVGFLLGVALVYRRTGRSARLAHLGDACAQLVTFGVALELLSYLVTRTGLPLADDALLHADRALGFDWFAWTAAAHADPRLAWALVAAYNSLLPQLVVAVMVLALYRGATQLLRRLVLSGLATVVISGLVPAVGLLPGAPHVPHFLALRADTLREIDLTRLEGLISFPSYHAALAVIVGHALWEVPYLRLPALLLNLVMLVATISEGGHYLVDVLAGCAVAAGAIALTPTRR